MNRTSTISDKTVKIWDAKSGKSTLTLSGAMQGIMCVSFNTKDDLIVAGSNDNATRVWSSQTGRLRHTLTGHLSKIFATRFVGDSSKVISGSHDRTIKIWDLAKGYCIKTIFSFSSCNDVILGDDSGTALVSGHVDNHIRFWDSRTGDCTSEITGIHTGQITSLAVSTDRRVVLSNSRDNTMKLIDVRMLQVVNTLFHDSYRPGVNWSKACFSPDGRYVAAANGDGSVLFWNLTTGKMEKTFKEHPNNCNAVAWHPAGHQVISCDKDKNVVVYE
ncbi:WD40 repeat-containing protein [Capsaspora owczarzaki ATCC 30864]|uniref:WD40 repeat-containing protein n=1 Tax=Capsaspora owczarzaki (strain ATCC 30864) TaxID=595528 RepID=A0A0D2WLL7_CAPO3|nr:WD40 repeat-containing protein [Capsaspora owczarzaki ATCC 30864]KJE90803.1 WD40 repeat-containing protein [Capsaspora owczarzaki ATCC 30864]|eukprot:XP_004348799.1 WD40 repeat-containing protein [Capsaspora owczarzaki ATCC 30864]